MFEVCEVQMYKCKGPGRGEGAVPQRGCPLFTNTIVITRLCQSKVGVVILHGWPFYTRIYGMSFSYSIFGENTPLKLEVPGPHQSETKIAPFRRFLCTWMHAYQLRYIE